MSAPLTTLPSGERFLPLLVKGYIFGTLASAVVLHFTIGLIAPGDGGTMLALGSLPILFTLVIVLALIGLVIFPVAALVSWPLRWLVYDKPLLGLTLAGGVGVALGAALTATEFQIGPDDFWSGPVVGLVDGVFWFFVVRSARPTPGLTGA